MKTILVVGFGAAILMALPAPEASAWGLRAHQGVTIAAADALPGGLKGFYQRHRLELPSLSPDVKPVEESRERRFAVDRLTPFPFRDLPHAEAEVLAKYGEAAKTAGRLPWLVGESYDKLVAAFKGDDKNAILAESDQLGQLVADLHNPLALTDNADGQKTGQPGLWSRFSERFPVRESRLKLNGDAAYLLDDPKGYVFSIVTGTYIWVDNIEYLDDLAHRQDSSYGGIFFETLEEKAGPLLLGQLNRAARDVASYWYTAWLAAGKPELR